MKSHISECGIYVYAFYGKNRVENTAMEDATVKLPKTLYQSKNWNFWEDKCEGLAIKIMITTTVTITIDLKVSRSQTAKELGSIYNNP